jgi:hypothetical protein
VVEDTGAMLRRIRILSGAGYVVFAIAVLITSGLSGLLGLTCSAVVTMINFLWLEEIASALLRPTPRLRAWKVTLRMLARYALLGAALTVTLVVARFNVVSVLLGFSVVVVGIVGEAVYASFRSFAD